MSVSDLEVLRSFQNQIAAIQRDAVWWLHTVVPSISKLAPKDYVHWYEVQLNGAVPSKPALETPPVTLLTLLNMLRRDNWSVSPTAAKQQECSA